MGREIPGLCSEQCLASSFDWLSIDLAISQLVSEQVLADRVLFGRNANNSCPVGLGVGNHKGYGLWPCEALTNLDF